MKILFVHKGLSSFVKKDLDILKSQFEVKEIVYQGKAAKWKTLLWAMWADLTFCWFSGKHAFVAALLSRLFGKKVLVVTGGYDVVDMPEINYGLSAYPRDRKYVKWTFMLANKILAVSESIKSSLIENLNAKPSKIDIIYEGFPIPDYTGDVKEELVLSVGLVNVSNLKRKGLETFVASAQYLPHLKFVLVGKWVDEAIGRLRKVAPQNVEFTDFISNERLEQYYREAKVYVQVSAHEGFCDALAEAMTYECVPVVTERGALPEIVTDTGFYVEFGNPCQTAEAIKKAMESNKGSDARQRIIKHYSLEKRKRALCNIVREC